MGRALASAVLGLLALLPGPIRADDLLPLAEETLRRSHAELRERGDPPPYFSSYRISDEELVVLEASAGAIVTDLAHRQRRLLVEVRVGDYGLDNTHRLRGDSHDWGIVIGGGDGVPLPIDDDAAVLRRTMALETDRQFRQAADRFVKVRADSKLAPDAEDASPDFSKEPAESHSGAPAALNVDRRFWVEQLRAASARLPEEPAIIDGSVQLRASARTELVVSSEGTAIRHAGTLWRVAVYGAARADDGMDIERFESLEGHTEAEVRDPERIAAAVARVVRDLAALAKAPKLEPYVGPALLGGAAAAVYFHEVLGHRVEGHRQKDEGDGQTFVGKVGERVLPPFLSVYDDPTVARDQGRALFGHYLFDDEGVRAVRASVVERGLFRGFLMSRSPVQGQPHSNGHGRAAVGKAPVGRQGTLFVVAEEKVGEEAIRRELLAEVQRQGKPFGLYIAEISGGFTLTGRMTPQSFNVLPTVVYRVYADGRPDELVRGADLIGTPLASLGKIIAASERTGVFNGYCGAESGWVPVSAVAPGILVSEMEIQRRELGSHRPPILPPPPAGGAR